jgi:phospholipase C
VMMENRSYDHVLGYRSLPDVGEAGRGLTTELIAKINGAEGGPFNVRSLHDADFPANEAGLMTCLPKSVGHEVSDVAEQLSARAQGVDGEINSPKGFVENFKSRIGDNTEGVVPDDVLGFYDQRELKFYDYLAENYAYCDRYYCSHPGPTLPNRMFSLAGDLMYDRHGFPIQENNEGDNFLLSRALTIYDMLARKGKGFRVYESFPSVTMLRFFARYATDTTNIVPIDRLAADVARGDLPPFTAIEPQMHAHPQDDDHPDADMLRGQIFVKRVYDTLTSNPALWRKTMLIVTYDEHGGFYDHAVPPVADVYQTPTAKRVADGLLVNVLGAKTAVVASRARKKLAGVAALGVLGKKIPGRGGVATALKIPKVSIPTSGLPVLTVMPTRQLIPYGVRVPTFVVSPWTAAGRGKDVVLDHCSILKTVLARFFDGERLFLSDRVHASNSFNDLLSEAAPRMNVPPSPGLPSLPIGVRRAPSPTTRIITPTLSRAEMRERPVDFHELSGRWARQLGR